MAKRDEKKSGGGLLGNIVFAAIIIGIGVALFMKFSAPSDDEILSQLTEPRTALEAYLKIGYEFRTNQRFADVQKIVTKDDWQWFQDNHMSLHQDHFNLASGIDPTQAAAIAHFAVLEELLSYGPSGPFSRVMEEVSGGSTETIWRVRQVSEFKSHAYDYRVKLVKEGKYWKIKDFGGGRADVERRVQPDDRVYVDGATIEADGTLAAVTGGAAPTPTDGQAMDAMGMGDMAGTGGDAGQPAGAQPPNGQPTQPGQAPPLEEADRYITQASQMWRDGRQQDSLNAAMYAYRIRLHHLGPNDPKTQEVYRMVAAAQAALQTAPTP